MPYFNDTYFEKLTIKRMYINNTYIYGMDSNTVYCKITLWHNRLLFALLINLKIAFFSLCIFPSVQATELWVIAHPNNPVKTLPESYIKDIFMGRIRTFPDGSRAVPVVMSHRSQEHDVFVEHLMGITRKDWRSNWAKLLFTGKGKPPREYKHSDDLINAVISNPRAIGYIVSDSPPGADIIILKHIRWH